MFDDDDNLLSVESAVYWYSSKNGPDLDDVIEAGIKALKLDSSEFQFVESEWTRTGHF